MPVPATERTTWTLMGDRFYAATFAPGLHGGAEWDPLIGQWRWYVYLGDDIHDEGQKDTLAEARQAAEDAAEGVMGL